MCPKRMVKLKLTKNITKYWNEKVKRKVKSRRRERRAKYKWVTKQSNGVVSCDVESCENITNVDKDERIGYVIHVVYVNNMMYARSVRQV